MNLGCKVISRIKSLYKHPDPRGYLLATIGSAYGHRRGQAVFKQNLAVISKAHAWLKGKRILILGTGPSAAALNKDTVGAYDFVVLLNHAINLAANLKAYGLPSDALGFFSQDRSRITEVSRRLTTSGIPKCRSIYMPDYPYSVISMDIHRVPVTLLGGFKPFRKAYVNPNPSGFARGGWHFLYTDTPISPRQLERAYAGFMDSTCQSPAILPYTGAFSAILFYSFFRPANISLIGCDFTGAYFSIEPMKDTFSLVQSVLSSYGIGLTNRSSELLSDDAMLAPKAEVKNQASSRVNRRNVPIRPEALTDIFVTLHRHQQKA